MASPGKSPGKAAKKEARPRSPPDKKRGKPLEESSSTVCGEQSSSSTLKGEDIQALSVRPEHLEKLRAPQPPKDSQKPRATTLVLVRKTRPLEEVRTGVKVAVARPLPQDAAPLPLDYTGPGGPRFDAQGMVLPHSILGSLEDFRREMEARGEMELVKRIPDLKDKHPLETGEQKNNEKVKSLPKSEWDLQGHALQNWNYHMTERRRQQNFISQLLQKPVEDLLMSQSNRFREIQEQREVISRGLPALESGHGCRVGSEFWSVPQHFGDELSGITATLTQTERGNPQPITHIAQPHSTRLESGTLRYAQMNSSWNHSQYLQRRQHELRDILREMDFNQPVMDALEVVGSNQPFTSLTVECSPLLEEEEQEEEDERMEGEHKENEDPLAFYDDVMLDVELVPALRFCGELARWTGSAISHQGEVGVSARLTFETVVGERTCSHLELRNEGSTAIYYSWHRLARPHSFTEARSQRYTQHFYFNTATAVILPGDTERILFTFKSVCPGIMSEVWQLHTHPVLLGGASLQVTLRGVALYQDKTADQRAALELELEQRKTISVCRSMVYELLRNVHTPERPSSPAQFYTTEEEHFHASNPNLHYHHEPLEALKRLWEQAHRSTVIGSGEAEDEHTPVEIPVWDLSVNHLRQVVLGLPQEDTDSEGVLFREEALRQYNSLILQLHQPQPPTKPLTLHCIGLQLWRELCDGLVSEALWIRHMLGLPENNNWGDTQHDQDSWEKKKKEEKTERKGAPLNKEEKKGGNAKEKEEKKGALKPAAKDKSAEDHGTSKKRVKEEKNVGKESKDRESSSTAVSPEGDNSQQDSIHSQLQRKYVHTLHQQVYVLMEGMIDSLCELLDEAERK
ncbi:LOW QUALITY PROTEIN: MYCBP-associated protein [Colossoma macropomum]|uniref:LOW QUALITY PROTEIN: MYCBP-associated protein n=1 Tax=Colossoma macropomum TaxID=42526 RepID=UPI001864F375|nr:LOW QUALITY PROTEIN: MYCBP-associated protein [Colossoma macropomum]